MILRRTNGAGRVRPGTARKRKAQCAFMLICAQLLSFDVVDYLAHARARARAPIRARDRALARALALARARQE